MKAGIYARISEDRDEDQLGVQRQVQDCEQLVSRRGWEVADRYIDNDVSAYSGKVRPEYRRLLQDVASGDIEAVVIYHQDRLHRQPRELEEFFDVCDKAGLTSLATVSGDVDLATHEGRFTARIMGAVARKSSDDQSRRLRRKAEEVAKAGRLASGGTRPFGFDKDFLTVRPAEAEIIRELASRLLAGETLRALCADLNSRGIKTPTGGAWISSPLRRMLASARISGQREHRGEIVAKAEWPGIIAPEETERIRAVFATSSRRAVRAPRSYVLKRLVRCESCDSIMVARPRDDGERRYVCAKGPGLPGCGRMAVLAEPLEEFVTEAVIWRLDTPALVQAMSGRGRTDAGEWYVQAERTASQLDELAVAYSEEAISMREWMAARDPLQRQLDESRRRIARDSNVVVLADYVGRGSALRARWPSLDIDRRHAIVAAVLSHVSVAPGRRGYNRFDPNRFSLSWRH